MAAPEIINSEFHGWTFGRHEGRFTWIGKHSVYVGGSGSSPWLAALLLWVFVLGPLLLLLSPVVLFLALVSRNVRAHWGRIFQNPGRALIGVKVNQFEGNNWRLDLNGDGLSYEAKPEDARGVMVDTGPASWAVDLRDVATVEAGRTVDWQKRRDLPGLMSSEPRDKWAWQTVSDSEFQTFIMTATGRRLVIHTANANREECSALAMSIRGQVEAARSAGATPVAASPVVQPAPEKGFSL